MKAFTKVYGFAVFLAFLLSGVLAYGREERLSSVRFIGLKNLSKNEIIKEAELKVTDEEILADVDKLRETIKKHPLVKDVSLAVNGSVLTVTVEEKEVIGAAVIAGNSLVPAVIGEDFSVLSLGRVCKPSGPVFIADRKEITENRISRGFANICMLIKKVKGMHPALYSEMEEVRILDAALLEIRLKHRPVICRMKADIRNLRILNYIVGYMDAAKHYPAALYIDGDSVVIR